LASLLVVLSPHPRATMSEKGVALMSNMLSSGAAPRTRSLAVNPCMRTHGDTSAIAYVGFKQGRPPRGVPR